MAKTTSYRINHSKLWPSVAYAGSTVVRFLLTKSGKRVQIIQRDGRKIRHKRLQRREEKD